MPILISLIVLFLAASLHAETSLAVDENLFLKKSYSFSPPDERSLDDEWLKPPEKRYPFPNAKVTTRRGVMGFEVNGEQLPAWSRSIGAMYTPSSPVERQLREQGMRLFIIDVGLTVNRYEERLLANAPNDVFAQFTQSVDNLLSEVPDAVIIVRLWMISVSKDFAEMYPQALLAGPDGKTDWGGTAVGGHTSRPNMLNEWRRYCGEHLYRFLHRLGDSPYASRVAGFYLAAMNSGEWWYYKGEGDPGWDYSKSQQEAFVRYVRHKYGEDPAAIAKAWGVAQDENLLKLPTLEERGQFPVRPNSKVSDYMQVLNMPVSNAASYFARIIKAATHGQSLAGMEIHMGGITYPINGTVLMNQMLDTPEIDFFGGPTGYGNRRPGESPFYRVALTSLAVHNKLWLNEGDYRTPLAYDTASGVQGEPPPDMGGMREVFRREFARGAIFNYSTYLMDFGWAWFLDPSITEQLAEVIKADAMVKQIGLERKAEIAFVTDQESQFYGNYFANPTGRMLESTMDRIGASWDFYEMRDFLENERFKQYKFVIFLNICALSDQERQQLEAVKSDGRHLLWMHQPGAISLSRKDVAPEVLVSSLIGMKMSVASPKGAVTLRKGIFDASKKEGPILGNERNLPQTRLNIEVSVSDGAEGLPIGNSPASFFCEDPNAKPLAVDEDGRAYFSMRKHKTWTSIYTAFCQIEPWVVRKLAKQAGCHLWLDTNDVSYISSNLVAVHASESGEKKLIFPKAQDSVFELFSGEHLKVNGEVLGLSMKKGETRMFALGDSASEQLYRETEGQLKKQKEDYTTKYPGRLMYADFRTRYIPKPPEESGLVPLLKWGHTSQPDVVLVAGPFASDAETIRELDERLVKNEPVKHWMKRDVSENIGTHSNDYLQVIKPLLLQSVEAGLGQWTAWQTVFPWNGNHRVAIAPGQSFAGSVALESKDEVDAQLHFYARGDTRLWVDGIEVKSDESGQFHQPIQVGPTRKNILFRIRGAEHPTGFAIKLSVKPDDTKDASNVIVTPDQNTTQPLPDSVMQWVPPPAE